MSLDYFKDCYEEGSERFVEELKELLRFKSISADSECEQDCRDCAGWLVKNLESAGFDARLIETTSKPLVFGEHKGSEGAPVVLLYGHYDVQPADPYEKWDSDPFEPEIREGRIYARGALDDKGQLFYSLKAAETLIKEGKLNYTLRVLLEGEEESSSAGLIESLPKLQKELGSDFLIVCDMEMAGKGQPTLVMGLRGLNHFTVRLDGPNRDLHSGTNGGAAPNPAQGMVRLLASLHNPDGTIAIEGYYDDVREVTESEKESINKAVFDEEACYREIGVKPVGGEEGIPVRERIGVRPTMEINGMYSGYTGEGTKTIIPSYAEAKVSARLAAGQDPERCLKIAEEHLERHTPKGLKLSITEKGVCGAAFMVDKEDPVVIKGCEILKEMFNTEPTLLWEGASVPVVAELMKLTGNRALLPGFGLREDNMHAPNESFELERFKQGYLFMCKLLGEIQESLS